MSTKLKLFVVPLLIKWIGSLIVLSCKIRFVNDAVYRERLKKGQAFVVCLWHDCSTMAGWVMRGQPVTVVVSESRDGEYVSRFANLMGIATIRGSSSRGAAAAVKAGLKLLRAGKPLAITPDGPRGPRYRFQPGGLRFSAVASVPLIPMHIKASRAWQLDSWDQQTFPKPFAQIRVVFGDPIEIDSARLDTSLDAVISDVERDMMHTVAQASQFQRNADY